MAIKRSVLAIQGSFRNNGLTSSMLKFAAEEAKKAGHDVEYINLFDLNVKFCRGCRKCFESAECVIRDDDMAQIANLIKKADVIMLAAPVYWANVPAVVKNLFDRMSGTSMEETSTFPKPRLLGKRYMLFTACNTPMPFARIFGQTTGLIKAVREYFKTSGIKSMGIVICNNTSKITKIPDSKLKKIRSMIDRI